MSCIGDVIECVTSYTFSANIQFNDLGRNNKLILWWSDKVHITYVFWIDVFFFKEIDNYLLWNWL